MAISDGKIVDQVISPEPGFISAKGRRLGLSVLLAFIPETVGEQREHLVLDERGSGLCDLAAGSELDLHDSCRPADPSTSSLGRRHRTGLKGTSVAATGP